LATANNFEQTTVKWEKFNLTKDVNKTTIEVDVLRFLVEFNITESIYNKLLQANVTFRDTEKVFLSMPFVGGETVDVAFQPQQGNKTDLIQLTLSDVNYKKFIKEYSTSFANQSISTFITNMSKNVLGKTLKNVDATVDSSSFAFPYQKFHYILLYLSQYAVNSKGYTNYMYYSDLDGANYVSLSTLLAQPVFMNLVEFESALNYAENKNFFKFYMFNYGFDLKHDAASRGFGSTSYTFNSTTKAGTKTETTYNNIISSQKVLGGYSLHKSDVNFPESFHYYSSSTNVKGKNAAFNNTINSGMEIHISLPGIIYRRCGKIATIDFKDFSALGQEDFSSMSGDYLVTTINHKITAGTYTQGISLLRNGQYVQSAPTQIKAV